MAAVAAKTPFGARTALNFTPAVSSAALSTVQSQALFLYKNADDRTRMRALLFHVYHLAIHNRYTEARDLLLMSHVQDGINEVDIHTRIIFNRTMAQLGLCAFRVGEYRYVTFSLSFPFPLFPCSLPAMGSQPPLVHAEEDTTYYRPARGAILLKFLRRFIITNQPTQTNADSSSSESFLTPFCVLSSCDVGVNNRQALYCLTDLHQSKNIKELIAQGTSSKYSGDRDAEREKLERKRVYPYHQHMSMDMLEAVHLLSAMFVEVPNMAINGIDNKRRIISKTFRRLFDHHSRQAFNGPPENTRDLIMGATKNLRTGEWSKALKYVLRLKMWELIPNSEHVKQSVTDKLKEEALRTYLFTFATQYVSISLHTLMSTFELTANVVYRITSKMMVNEQLPGTWDQPTASIVMHAAEPTPLQRAALKYADKATVFLEQNERAGESRAAAGGGDRPGTAASAEAGASTGGEPRRSGYGGYGSGYQKAGDSYRGRGGRGSSRGGYRGRGGSSRSSAGGGDDRHSDD